MRAGTVALLVAGRGTARIAQWAAGVVLLAAWGPVAFAAYAAATGVMSWLFALSGGTERAALVLVGAPGGRRLEPLFVWFALAPFAAALLGWAAVALLAPGHPAVTYAAAAALYTGTGTATVLVGLWRLRGAARADAAAFATIGAGYGVAVALALLAGAGVGVILGVLTATAGLVTAVLLAALWRTVPVRPAVPRAEALGALRAVGLLAAGEAVALAGVPVLYAEQAGRVPAPQISAFYVAMLVSGAAGVLWGYLLRLWQPRLSAWLGAHPGAAAALVRRVALGAALAGAGVSAAGTAALLAWGPSGPLLVAAVAAEIAVYTAVTWAGFVVESGDDRARARSTLSGAVALAVTAVAGWWLVGAGGATGAVLALVAGLAVRGPLLRVGERSARAGR
ncbi:hypothetical protein ACQP1P_32835 [Dactylosporangium sp. CA-052675]|uniref:hypothetical protein n=1 Tax=Dactylosporangium sp. CA-052675 TaxID=3239927 RepID=UPI003D8FD62E